MDVRRRPASTAPTPDTREPLHRHRKTSSLQPQASDALPLPLYLTNAVFILLFFSLAYFLLLRWGEKIRNSTPLRLLSFSELAAIVALFASVIYLLGFFGISFVQSFVSTRGSTDEDEEVGIDVDSSSTSEPLPITMDKRSDTPIDRFIIQEGPITTRFASFSSKSAVILTEDDEKIVESVIAGTTPSYSLESSLGDCRRAAAIRREALQRVTGRSLDGLPLEGFDYESILGQCCEMPVGFVQIPVGIAGPLFLDGKEFSVPMATTEGCLVASTNRGCKAIYLSGGATSVLLKDGMTRAPVVRFGSAKRATELKFFLEDPENFEIIAIGRYDILYLEKLSYYFRIVSILYDLV